MKILLKKNINTLGKIGDVVDVANGYARNYLLPKKFAVIVTKGNIEQINFQRLKNEEKQQGEIKELQGLADEISNISYTITVKTNEEGKLFGSVTASNIAETISKKGFQVDENMVIAPFGTILGSDDKVVKKFNDGVTAKGRFELPLGSTHFTLEVEGQTIKQDLVIR